MTAQEITPSFNGIRSRLLKEPFKNILIEYGFEPKEALEKASLICKVFSTQDKKHADQVTTAVYLSPAEISSIAQAVAEGKDPKEAAKKANRQDAADIALFGRMVANDATLNVEGAAMFSHALSTHRATNDVDFYSAVDDRKQNTADSGAGMLGVLEFTSATYYRYAAINLDLLFDEKHLKGLPTDDRKSIVAAFLRALLVAVPGARKNSMNASTLPFEVLGIYKDKGQPLQLINAFEDPVTVSKNKDQHSDDADQPVQNHNDRSGGRSLAAKSVKRLEKELNHLKTIWNIEHQEELWLSKTNIDHFISRLSSYVE